MVSLDDVLELGELRTKCINDIKAGINATATFIQYYVHKPATDHTTRMQGAVQAPIHHAKAIDPYVVVC